MCLIALVLQPAAARSDSDTLTLVAVEGAVYGNVQKVGFRAFIFREAICYNLGGTIENMPDGSVRFFLQGKKDSLEQALVRIRKGPKKASVTSVQLDNRPVQDGISSVVANKNASLFLSRKS